MPVDPISLGIYRREVHKDLRIRQEELGIIQKLDRLALPKEIFWGAIRRLAGGEPAERVLSDLDGMSPLPPEGDPGSLGFLGQ